MNSKIRLLDSLLLQEQTNFLMRLVPFYFNVRIKMICQKVLRDRAKDKVGIIDAWEKFGISERIVYRFTKIIELNFSWTNNLFYPTDECYVVFCQWKNSLTDDLSYPIFLCDIENEFSCEVSHHIVSDTRMSLIEFFQDGVLVPMSRKFE